jgi:branched-chain amino acid aminotransferase/para-aminobenzoate synthetase component 1
MTDTSSYVWLNHELVPLAEARISVDDRGFLYGDGFFETLKARAGRLFWLNEHLARLAASAQVFRLTFPAGIPWEERLNRLLAANGLQKSLAAVKILLSRGQAAGVGLPEAPSPTLVMWARPYTPPPLDEYAAGWPLVTFPERRSTFLGKHKSLNYLFYLAARQYALDQGAKEALILETGGQVSEGAATSLIYRTNGRFFTPRAASALSGVSLAVLARALKRRGQALEATPTAPSHLREAQGLWMVNSLMGVMPVASLDGLTVPLESEATRLLTGCLEEG